MLVRDRKQIASFTAFLALIREARRQQPDAFAWRTECYEFERERLAIDLLLGQTGLREALESEQPLGEIEASWSEGLREFESGRSAFLRYP